MELIQIESISLASNSTTPLSKPKSPSPLNPSAWLSLHVHVPLRNDSSNTYGTPPKLCHPPRQKSQEITIDTPIVCKVVQEVEKLVISRVFKCPLVHSWAEGFPHASALSCPGFSLLSVIAAARLSPILLRTEPHRHTATGGTLPIRTCIHV